VLGLAEVMSELAGRAPKIEFRPARAGEIHQSTAAIDRARADLGYAPAYDPRAGLGEIWEQVWPEGERHDRSA